MMVSGCFIGTGDCGFEPIGASVKPPVLAPIFGDAVGQCGKWVKIDGYLWNQSLYGFDLDAATLEPVGEADEVAKPFVAPLAGPTTYAIPGVDSSEAVAIEAADGDFLVFTHTSDGGFPDDLCPLLAASGNPDPGPCD